MAQWQHIVITGSILIGSFLFTILFIRAIVGGLWGTLSSRFPACPVLPGAVSKGAQSIALYGWGGFNHCITITADERHLHLTPWAIVRVFGAPPVSIPWDAITDVRPSWPKSYSKALVGGVKFQAPAWCLELAATGEPAQDRSV